MSREVELEAEIERLTRERDEARKWQSVAAELSDKLHGTPCAAIRWEQERQDLHARAEAAERKVEKLREALHQISLCSQNSASSKEECGRIARAALAETEKGDE